MKKNFIFLNPSFLLLTGRKSFGVLADVLLQLYLLIRDRRETTRETLSVVFLISQKNLLCCRSQRAETVGGNKMHKGESSAARTPFGPSYLFVCATVQNKTLLYSRCQDNVHENNIWKKLLLSLPVFKMI